MKATTWVTAAIGATIVIGSVKFGAVFSTSGVGFYPMEPLEWIIGSWPAFFFPVVTAGLLALVLATPPRAVCLDKQALPFLAPIGLVLLAGVVGLINTSERDAALQFLAQMLGVANFATAVLLHCRRCPEARRALLGCLAAGTGLVMIPAWYQMSGGFQQNQDMLVKMAELYGWDLPMEMQIRLNDRRVYGSFTYPNSFAAHALLTVPVVAALMWIAGRDVDPPKVSQPVLMGAALVIGLWPLARSGSRGAAVGLFGAICVLGLAFLLWKRARWGAWRGRILAGAAIMTIVLVAGFAKIQDGRGFRSATVRFDYYAAALKLSAEHPLAGAGMGEFYPNYMRLKPAGAEETRMPHNLFLNLLSQCGIVGALAAIVFLGGPLWLAWLWRRGQLKAQQPILAVVALTSAMAWSLHALLDFNIKTPITVALFCTLPMLVLEPCEVRKKLQTVNWQLVLLAICAIIGLLGLRRAVGEREYQMVYSEATRMSMSEQPMSLREMETRVRRAAEAMPHSPYPWEKLGGAAASAGHFELARSAFSQAVRRAPHRAAFHSNLAQLALAEGDAQGALRNLDEALRWYPHEARYLALRQVAERLANSAPPRVDSP